MDEKLSNLPLWHVEVQGVWPCDYEAYFVQADSRQDAEDKVWPLVEKQYFSAEVARTANDITVSMCNFVEPFRYREDS